MEENRVFLGEIQNSETDMQPEYNNTKNSSIQNWWEEVWEQRKGNYNYPPSYTEEDNFDIISKNPKDIFYLLCQLQGKNELLQNEKTKSKASKLAKENIKLKEENDSLKVTIQDTLRNLQSRA